MPEITGYYLTRDPAGTPASTPAGWAVKVYLDTGLTGDAPGWPTYTVEREGVLFSRGFPGEPEETVLLRYPTALVEAAREAGRPGAPAGAWGRAAAAIIDRAWRITVGNARHRWPGIRTKGAEPQPAITRDDRAGLQAAMLAGIELAQPPVGALYTRDIAARLGVHMSTVRAYLARGQMPQPSGYDYHGHPFWLPARLAPWRPVPGGWARPKSGPTFDSGLADGFGRD